VGRGELRRSNCNSCEIVSIEKRLAPYPACYARRDPTNPEGGDPYLDLEPKYDSSRTEMAAPRTALENGNSR